MSKYASLWKPQECVPRNHKKNLSQPFAFYYKGNCESTLEFGRVFMSISFFYSYELCRRHLITVSRRLSYYQQFFPLFCCSKKWILNTFSLQKEHRGANFIERLPCSNWEDIVLVKQKKAFSLRILTGMFVLWTSLFVSNSLFSLITTYFSVEWK